MTTSLVTAPPRVENQDLLDKIIAEQGGRPGALLSILEKVQEQHRNKYLPMETLEYVAMRTGIPQAQVYGVATFYALFNLEAQGTHTVAICRGTACHTRGSRALLERLKLQLNLSRGRGARRGRQAHAHDARPQVHDPHRRLLRPVRARAGRRGEPRDPRPREGAGADARGRQAAQGERAMTRIQDIAAFSEVREAGLAKLLPSKPRITVGMGTCGSGNGAEAVYHAFSSEIDARGLAVQLAPVGCFGFCAEEPLVNVWVPGRPMLILHRVQPNHVDGILNGLSHGKLPPPEIVLCKIEEWDHLTGHVKYGYGYPELPHWHEVPFFKGQVKIVLRNCGLINPDDIEEYIAVGGYQALYKVLIEGNPAAVIEQLKAAKLRGRGGAGYLTGNKWEFLRTAAGPEKYIICNADEGDPGAYMNRNEIESDPHALLEGMLIGGYVTGATKGIIYVRAEYPLAVLRLERAIDQAKAYGLIGDNVLGRGFKFEIEMVEGAGAFVCGEETALIESLEGHSGRPRPRPPFPAQKGLWGKPTNINNVETWYNVAPIVSKGPAWFTETGSAKSAGTKVFSLVGKVQEHRPRRDAARHAARQVHLRHRRGRHERPRHQGRPDGRALGRHASRPRCSTRRSTTRPSRSSARSWARAAWSCWTKTTAWWTSPATSSSSPARRAAASASPAAWASTRPCAC